jgi:hypothetical protein
MIVKRFLSRTVVCVLYLLTLFCVSSEAQQDLGSINGVVTDSTGGVVQQANVKVRNLATNVEESYSTKFDGSFNIVSLPIGTYEVSISKDGFQSEVHSSILVQAGLPTTVNASLHPGQVSSQITVTGTPLLNETDTTNGYVLDSELIQNAPLGTGSFTQLALLSPGVNADLLSGSGSGAGLGNQNIFANGQRDSSNSFNMNGVLTNNLFNGKSSSSVSDNRFVLNTGENFAGQGEIQTGTSVYSAIGQALPSPPTESIEELEVKNSMYDATEGAYSGAHIHLQTKSGGNEFHGQAYDYYQTSGWNAAPFFRNADPTLPANQKVPVLHRQVFGVAIGGPIYKDKLFFFGSYQGQRVHDLDSSISGVTVPQGLTNDRSADALANLANADFGTTITAANIDPVALKIMNAKLPNGQYLIPSVTVTDPNAALQLGYNALVQGPETSFSADQANGNIDYNFSQKDRLSGKYYFQNDPTTAPFIISQLGGFPQTLDAGSQVFSLENTTIFSSNFTWVQRFGFVREKAYANTTQQFTNSDFGINVFGIDRVPGFNIATSDPTLGNALSFGPSSNFANAGMYQNQWEAATSANWIVGRHTLAFGFNWDHMQLNIVNKNNETSALGFDTFADFLQGNLCTPVNGCSSASTIYLNGETNRYYRANQVGLYAQDTFRVRNGLTVNFGIRWDWDGPLVEKDGLLTNFYPKDYSYDASTDTITSTGLVVAGNNKGFGTKGVSDSTLTGRQWGFGPRLGAAWTPSFVKNIVVRAGFGMYYDRGEYFTELSPSAGQGISGPFGVTTEQPFVVPLLAQAGATFSAPFGTTAPPPPPQNLSEVATLLPNIGQLENQSTTFCTNNNLQFCGPFQFAGYAPNNKLPYTENWMLDLQWQPQNDLMFRIAYVGNHGVHEVIPIPFNQALTATPSHPVNGQIYSYGYSVPGVAAENVQSITDGYLTGNASLRVPYIGYDPNSQYSVAAGVSHYNALQVNVTKRISHGLTINAAYTWSHALDEESGAQLFYNGNNPLDLRSGYGNSDFDRTHVFTVFMQYQLPNFTNSDGFVKHLVNGWGVSSFIVAQSGQPYSVIDYSGGVAGLYYGGGQDAVTNPIIPIGGVGSTSTTARLQGTTGVNAGNPVLNINAFGVPLLAPGQNGVPPCDPTTGACDIYETGFGGTGRNIFRGPFQSRVDMTLYKEFHLTERFVLKLDLQAFNLFNHPSFDTPNNNVRFNPYFGNPPDYVGSSYTPCYTQTTGIGVQGAYACPPSGQLGYIQHTIGSPRFLQIAAHLRF